MAGITRIPEKRVVRKSYLFASSGTFTVPTTIPTGVVYVTLLGGGGAGGRGMASTNTVPGSGGVEGGNGVYYQRCPITGLTAGSSVTVTVGTGGVYGSTGAGTSSFGAYISAAGGGAGPTGDTQTGATSYSGWNGGKPGSRGAGNWVDGGNGGDGGAGFVLVEWDELA